MGSLSEISIICPKCHRTHNLYIPPRLDYDGGDINCYCGYRITFIERMECSTDG